ncbi:MAG: guanylate kinase [Rhodobiaceae bacterium]|nr:guanylate kinase [Rhodobiaceae bacterium]MCC0056506.1 guanylate kinase [Rhodobiaceae bacterium]
MNRRGMILILSSPSGAGKTTIARNVREKEPRLEVSVSVTTRTRRPSEVDGTHYHFITPEKFIRMRDAGDLLEWAEVHGNYYGTPREPVENALAEGRDILFDIDWQGTLQVYDALREDTVSVFILPPSAEELRRRLERRAEDSAETISRRLANAREEIRHWREYDFVIVNHDLEISVRDVQAILVGERNRRARLPDVEAFADQLIADLGRSGAV